jgi:hypothetical protein
MTKYFAVLGALCPASVSLIAVLTATPMLAAAGAAKEVAHKVAAASKEGAQKVAAASKETAKNAADAVKSDKPHESGDKPRH